MMMMMMMNEWHPSFCL